MQLSIDLVSFSFHNGVLLIGFGIVIPSRLQRLALQSKAEIRSHLSQLQQDPLAIRSLRDLASRLTSHHFTRDADLITYLVDLAASPQHSLSVIDLGYSRFCIRPVALSTIHGGMDNAVQRMSLEDRFQEVLKRAVKHLTGSVGEQLKALLTPQALAVAAGGLTVLAGAHFFGVGEAADVFLVAVGFAFVGLQIFEVAKLSIQSIKGTINAATEADLEAAAKDLAGAIAIIGVTVFFSLVAKTLGMKKLARSGPSTPKAAGRAAVEQAPKPARKPTAALPPKTDMLKGRINEAVESYKKGDYRRADDLLSDKFGEQVGISQDSKVMLINKDPAALTPEEMQSIKSQVAMNSWAKEGGGVETVEVIFRSDPENPMALVSHADVPAVAKQIQPMKIEEWMHQLQYQQGGPISDLTKQYMAEKNIAWDSLSIEGSMDEVDIQAAFREWGLPVDDLGTATRYPARMAFEEWLAGKP